MQPKDYGLDRAAYSTTEAMRILSLGKTSLYDVIGDGRLKATKFGSKTMFLAPDIVAFLERLRQPEAV